MLIEELIHDFGMEIRIIKDQFQVLFQLLRDAFEMEVEHLVPCADRLRIRYSLLFHLIRRRRLLIIIAGHALPEVEQLADAHHDGTAAFLRHVPAELFHFLQRLIEYET